MTEPLDSTPEEWRPVKGYEFYSVSNLGRIRREISPWRRSVRLLKPHIGQKGYLDVGLRAPGKNKTIRLHRLVALAFLEPVPGKECINHKNGDKTDPRADNLEWCTMSENQRHRHDVLKKGALGGETHNWAKLTTAQVLEIRQLWAEGQFTQLEIAKKYGVAGVHDIVNGKDWKHLPLPYDPKTLKKHWCHGERQRFAKLTDEKVLEIRKLRLAGETCTSIGRKYSVTASAISAITTGLTWKHLLRPS